MNKSVYVALLTAGAVLILAGHCVAQKSAVNTTTHAAAGQVVEPAQFQQRHPRYRLTVGDTLDVLFEYSPELNQTLSIQPDGFATLRDIGDLHIAGQSVSEVTETLRKAYATILNDPSITIVLKDFQRPYFVVDGQVSKPGKYELRGDTTVTEGIAMAGGFLPTAKHSQVLLFRRASDEWLRARILNVKAMVKRGDLREDMFLQPGDMLVVPKNFFSKIDPFIPRAVLGMYAQPF
jgi:protein involved in polysaccharide export with SLBB domain